MVALYSEIENLFTDKITRDTVVFTTVGRSCNIAFSQHLNNHVTLINT